MCGGPWSTWAVGHLPLLKPSADKTLPPCVTDEDTVPPPWPKPSTPQPSWPHRTHHPCIQNLANTLTPRPHPQRLCFNEAQFGPGLRIPSKSPAVILTCCQYCQDTFLIKQDVRAAEVPDISTFQTLYFPKHLRHKLMVMSRLTSETCLQVSERR